MAGEHIGRSGHASRGQLQRSPGSQYRESIPRADIVDWQNIASQAEYSGSIPVIGSTKYQFSALVA